MYVAVVLHPDCLKKEHFESEGYSTQARLLFKGIRSNGLVIVDSDGRLKRMVGNAIRELPTQHGQRLQIWWEEFLKKPKRIVAARPEVCAALKRIDDGVLPGELARKCPVDAVVVDDAREMNEVTLRKYDESEAEERRRSFMDGSGMLDGLAGEHADELIIRAIRYSKWLRFYDKQIGKGGNNLEAFRRGIGHILALWRRHGHFTSDKEGGVTIYTCEASPIQGGEMGSRVDEKRRRNCQAHQNVLKKLFDPLRSDFPGWKIELCVKRQTKDITHPRHLEAQAAIISFERGFDFLKKAKRIAYKRTSLHVDNKVREHLVEFRKLPEAEYLTE
ncbi:MAG: hypothetical protein ACOX5J_17235 [Candidatus Hydrogenedentales bacterium]|jgi:hypothetical protein